MTQPNKFKNESQDARRHDQQHEVHPPGAAQSKSKAVKNPQPKKRK